MNKIFLFIFVFSHIIASEYYYMNGKKVYLEEIKNSKVSRSSDDGKTKIKYYTADDGTVFGVNNYILIKCNYSDCLKDFKGNNIKGTKKISDEYYTIELENNEHIFEISRQLSQQDYIKSAHPDFIITLEER